jgi:hypothetical protein
MGADERARGLAGRQESVIHRDQLRAAGLSDSQIKTRVRDGRLVRKHAAVYLMGGAAFTFRGRVRAALLAAGPDAFASHTTAAQLWGPTRGPVAIEVTVPGS